MARGTANGQRGGARNGDTVGFEAKLWQAADALRPHQLTLQRPRPCAPTCGIEQVGLYLATMSEPYG